MAGTFPRALALTGGGAYFLYLRHAGQPMTILVGGRPIATARNAAAANQILADAESERVGAAFAGQTPVRLQPDAVPASPGGRSRPMPTPSPGRN